MEINLKDIKLFEQIKYMALLGPREEPKLLNIPQEYLNSPILWYFGNLPQSMYHFIYGVEQYYAIKFKSLQLGYRLIIMHPDVPKNQIDLLPCNDGTPIVILMCTEDVNAIKTYNSLFDKFNNNNILCISNPNCQSLISIKCSKATSADLVWKWFFDYATNYYDIDYSRHPFSVPMFNESLLDKGNVFSPSRVNTQIINSIQGNWGYRKDYSKEENLELSKKSAIQAMSDPDGDSRQQVLIEQIHKIRQIEDLQATQLKELDMTEEQYRAPLVIAAPYTSVEMRKIVDKTKLKGQDLKMAKLLERVMDAGYTKSYILYRLYDDEHKSEEELILKNFQGKIVWARMAFMDNVAMLHCSTRFSPYFRMPILGKNINTELSYVGYKNLSKITSSPNRNKTIRQVMDKVGRAMASTALCSTTINAIKNDCSQIVALTDLPIEWLMLDDVPLGFSHDVCRIPETPVQSLLTQYEESIFTPYIIPKDIIKKTLVVYGNDEPYFIKMQNATEMLKNKYGFQTRRCLNKNVFFETVREINPDLLIIDTHGGVDDNRYQSFIMMGNDRVYGDDVINSGIHPRLVFLSACNTFTAYNSIGTIANAFFQAGANAVSTSYMPLEVLPATTLYCRLIANLASAAQKKIHRNWLSFISHLLRTSYIHAPILCKAQNISPALSKKITFLSTKSMFFQNRPKIYKELNSNEFTKEAGINYDTIIPHYLMYSTIGRADLIRFESFIDKIISN